MVFGGLGGILRTLRAKAHVGQVLPR